MARMSYGERFEQALVYAARLHRDQVRKHGDVPYVTHLLAVASLVGEAGGTEDEIIAALLHDAAEDQGGEEALAAIRSRFGDVVASIVSSCTDTLEKKKPDWRPRKERYLATIPHKTPSALLVSLADKLHNVRSMLVALREDGGAIWGRFKGGRDGTLWYHRSLLEAFRGRPVPRWLFAEYERAVADFVRLAT